MLRAVVFDDEYIVLQGLQAMIDWNAHGIELCGTATNGQEGLELFRHLRPELIFTDIRMPGMDGLQLVETVLQEAPETYCIVFSGFNEFEYVKKAIQLGVRDYLEKPITIQSIEKAIQKSTEYFQTQRDTQTIRQKWQESRLELLEKVSFDLLFNRENAVTRLEAHLEKESEKLQGVTVVSYSHEQPSLPKHVNCVWVPVQNDQERLLVVYHFEALPEDFWEMMDHLSADSVAGIGRTYAEPELAGHSYKEAQKALRTGRLMNAKGNVFFEEISSFPALPPGITEHEERIIMHIRTGNRTELMEQVDQFIAWLRVERLDPELAESQILKLIYLAMQTYRESGAYNRLSELEKQFLPHLEIRQMSAEGKMLDWFRAEMERLADYSLETREKTKHGAIDRARAYIERNLSRDLTLSEVAEHVDMNPAYLSVLFKEQMGESYIKFLTRSRMELAKQLLSKGYKVAEVSEKVGYHTYRHFSEVFKKFTGVPPGQYKDAGTGS